MYIMSIGMQRSEIPFSKPISHELLEEMLLELAVKNLERIQSCKNGEYLWSSDTTEFVFNICMELNLKRSVKYLALEIYERFISEHIADVREGHSELLKTNKATNWITIEQRLEEQSVLRILTSVQLASKLESHYDHVMPRRVSEILEKSGKPFTLNGIFSSELRVMKTLKYKINLTTPALYLEMLLYILFVNDPTVDESLYESSITVLDFVYLHRSEVYNGLYEALTGESNEEVERDFNPVFVKVKADYMLLATSIIASTAYMLTNERYEIILEQLYQITRIIKKDIRNFSIIIAYVILNNISD